MQDKKTGSMGRKKLARPSAENLNSTISSMLVPSHVPEHFEIRDAHGYRAPGNRNAGKRRQDTAITVRI